MRLRAAHGGSFDLANYRALRAWLDRAKTLPGYVEMNG